MNREELRTIMVHKKKVLIAYGGMVVGGSTTALLSMLKEWDYNKYVLIWYYMIEVFHLKRIFLTRFTFLMDGKALVIIK